MEAKEERELLPSNVVPTHYDLELTPDLVKFSYAGTVRVKVDVVEATSSVQLHSKELYIKKASFTVGIPTGDAGEKGSSVELVETSHNRVSDFLTLGFKEQIPPCTDGVLEIQFDGCLNDQMAGFYRSHYTTADGEKRIMASTQFEAIDARRCFPCWDEPAVKASFGVTMVVPQDRTAFSNMPEVSVTTLKGGLQKIVFQDSPVMSTYLLAFCVGEFDFIQGRTEHGVMVRCYTPPGKAAQGTFALDVALKSLDLYDDFFKTPFPLPKLDMVAIPEFAMGAMENWGLVTYREVDLLIDSQSASSQQKERVCTVVTHELAHQWFGNLVTMEWWDNLWLNEGFASWMQNWAADIIFPDYGMWDGFFMSTQNPAMRLDALRSSHPIQVPIRAAREVEEVFDAISYYKGASVVNMVHMLLGPDNFRQGLQVYMERHQYGNTVTSDLWQAWAEVSGVDVPSIMSTWTEQMGFPVVSVVSCAAAEGGKLRLTLRQNWFLADGSDVSADEDKLWTIPLAVMVEGEAEPVTLTLAEREQSFEVPATLAEPWVKLNMGQSALVRCHYTPALLGRLRRAIEAKALPGKDRAAVLSDLLAFAKARRVDAGDLISFLSAFTNDDDYVVWVIFAEAAKSLAEALSSDERLHAAFKRTVASAVAGAAERCGWDARPEDGHTGKLLRAVLISMLGTYGADDEKVVSCR